MGGDIFSARMLREESSPELARGGGCGVGFLLNSESPDDIII